MASPEESLWVFVDDSNLWIEGKKALFEHKQLQEVNDPIKGRHREDSRGRIEFGRTAKVIANGRQIKKLHFYCSEPPKADSVWKRVEEAWCAKPTKCQRNFKGKEKEVDTQLTCDAVELVCEQKPAVLVIVSGDLDFRPLVEKAMKKKWKVEVYAWKRNLSQKIRDLTDTFPDAFSFREFDGVISYVMFAELIYRPGNVTKEKMKTKLEKDTLVVEMYPYMIFTKDGHNDTVNKEITDRLEEETKLPIQYYVMPPDDKTLPRRVVLAVCVVDSAKKGFFRNASKALKPYDCVPVKFKTFQDIVPGNYFEEMYKQCRHIPDN